MLIQLIKSFYFDFVLSNCPSDIIHYFLASLHGNKDWQTEEVSWTDMFEEGRVLMSENIGSFPVVSFSLSWSLKMGKYDVLPWIAGLFTIFLFLKSFSIASSMMLKSTLVKWFFWINSVTDLLSGHFLLFLISAKGLSGLSLDVWGSKQQQQWRQ